MCRQVGRVGQGTPHCVHVSGIPCQMCILYIYTITFKCLHSGKYLVARMRVHMSRNDACRVCAYVFVLVRDVHMYINNFKCMHVWGHSSLTQRVCVWYTHMHTHTQIHIQIYTFTYICIYMYIYIYIHIYTYVYTYTHTHVHIYVYTHMKIYMNEFWVTPWIQGA